MSLGCKETLLLQNERSTKSVRAIVADEYTVKITTQNYVFITVTRFPVVAGKKITPTTGASEGEGSVGDRGIIPWPRGGKCLRYPG